eukprot:2487844-Ditylum_brightwellii.AAC.1
MFASTLTLCIHLAVGDQEPLGQCNEKLLANQSESAVEAMFDGLLNTKWAHIQDAHLWEKSLWTPQSNGTQWVVKIVKFLWSKFFMLWHKGNKIVHGSNEKE